MSPTIRENGEFANALQGSTLAVVLNGAIVYTILGLLVPGFRFFAEKDRNLDQIANLGASANPEEIFDFIVVGGGSAGSALAAELSSHFSVLVLEAGGAPGPAHMIPMWAYLQFNIPEIDWSYKTVPQRQACFGLNNNTSIWPAGKVLGGSSQLNAMINIRGNVQGFDDIATKTGDPRWRMSNILRYYKAQENYDGWFPSRMSHGSKGTLNIERPTLCKFAEYFNEAGRELGYPIRDPNAYGPYTEGFANVELYLKDGRRSDAYHEMLKPAAVRNRENLVIRKFSQVTKVLFREHTTEAVGVEYIRHGRLFEAKARREVILSSGTIKTAQILMLSGIGPKEHLREHGIRPILDLPVGQYLQDKYGALLGPFLVEDGFSRIYERDISLKDVLAYFSTGQGPLRTSLSESTWAIITNHGKSLGRTTRPDVHTYVLSVSMPEEISAEIGRSFNLKPSILKHFAKAGKVDSFFQLVTLNNQIGKGTIKLRDRNPGSDLVIDPHYLENEDDTKTLLDGVKLAVKLVENTTWMGRIRGRLMPGHLPGCETFQWKSDGYYECVMRHTTITAFKFAGTAPIGKGLEDPDAVVDSQLRVLGTTGLRVVDGSVLQQRHTSINDVTCRMLGGFAADMILETLGRS